MFDSHCHLTDLDDPHDALHNARCSGVGAVLTCGYNAASNAAILKLSSQYEGLCFSIGLHPWFANESIDDTLRLIEQSHPTAIGELGLDLWGETPIQPLDRQQLVLDAQLDLARKLALPVTLHSRKAADALLPIVRRHAGVRGALHAFSGSWEQLRAFLDLGLYVGVGGAVTRSRAKRVHRIARETPLDRLLLETDAPAIGMDIVEPPHVRPAHLPRIAEAVATLRNMSLDDVIAQTDANAVALFGPVATRSPRRISV